MTEIKAQHIAGGPCPECAQGKHTNCTGEAWCDVCDDVAGCPCRFAHPENHACALAGPQDFTVEHYPEKGQS